MRDSAMSTRVAARVHMSESDFSMESLTARIQALKEAPEPEAVRILVLDSMVPGQRLRTPVPITLTDTFDMALESGTPLVMVGRHRLQLHTHGVECIVDVLGLVPGNAVPFQK